MSVPVNQRSHGKLEAAVKARELASYTLKITSNKKIFTEEYQESLTNRIIDAAIAIHTKVWSANNVLVNSTEDLAKRLSLQEEAAIECNNLLSLIELAQPVFHLASKRVTYWSKKTIEVRGLIRGWRDNDRRRYAEKYGV